MKKNKGFTLIELMVVICIIAILAVAAISAVQDARSKYKAKKELSQKRDQPRPKIQEPKKKQEETEQRYKPL